MQSLVMPWLALGCGCTPLWPLMGKPQLRPLTTTTTNPPWPDTQLRTS